MEIRIIVYKLTGDDFKAPYDFFSWEIGKSLQDQLRSSQGYRRRHEEALKKAKTMGLCCIPGGKSRKGASNE